LTDTAECIGSLQLRDVAATRCAVHDENCERFGRDEDLCDHFLVASWSFHGSLWLLDGSLRSVDGVPSEDEVNDDEAMWGTQIPLGDDNK
jgi:hypothetical protein